MALMPLPSQRLLNRLLSYDPGTGELAWRERPAWLFSETPGRRRKAISASWNSRYANKAAGTTDALGYVRVIIFFRSYAAHRIIWKMVHGTDPVVIDHINRIRSDNSLKNLRNVPSAENALNVSLRSDNASGTPGVFWHSGFNRWIAKIKVRGKEYALGRFHDKDSAVLARREAEIRLNAQPRSL